VLADNDGSDRAVEDTSLFKQLENMRQFYSAHNICFVLVGIEQINNSILNYMQLGQDEPEFAPYVLPDVMNVFIHSTLVDEDGEPSNGIAYGIPGTRVSVVASAINSSVNLSTLPHEIGHALGLYHTFEKTFGEEKITRGAQIECVNCTFAGDLLCDTPADPHSEDYDTGSFINAGCEYFGSTLQYCDGEGILYKMDPTNIMAYGRRECRNRFTNGQGERMRDVLIGTLDHLLAPEELTISSNVNVENGRRLYGARNHITISASSFVATNSAKVNFSAKTVTIPAGTRFAPTTDGYTVIRSNKICQ
jgi:hypothetical protein